MNDLSPERHLAIRVSMMPRDTNPHGTIFGGVLLSYIDQAGAIAAQHAIGKAGWAIPALVTVAMNRVEFHEPVYVGDTVSFYGVVTRLGTKSITTRVTVETHRGADLINLTEAEVIYVAVDAHHPERPAIPIRPGT